MLFLVEINPLSIDDVGNVATLTIELCNPAKIFRELSEVEGRMGPKARVRAIALSKRERYELARTTWPDPSQFKEFGGVPVVTYEVPDA